MSMCSVLMGDVCMNFLGQRKWIYRSTNNSYPGWIIYLLLRRRKAGFIFVLNLVTFFIIWISPICYAWFLLQSSIYVFDSFCKCLFDSEWFLSSNKYVVWVVFSIDMWINPFPDTSIVTFRGLGPIYATANFKLNQPRTTYLHTIERKQPKRTPDQRARRTKDSRRWTYQATSMWDPPPSFSLSTDLPKL
jgi:hypothetical protein